MKKNDHSNENNNYYHKGNANHVESVEHNSQKLKYSPSDFSKEHSKERSEEFSKECSSKSEYVGCYKLKKEIYGNIVFLRLSDGVLYGSVLCPFSGSIQDNLNLYRNCITQKTEIGGRYNKLFGFSDHSKKVLLSDDYRLSSDCPYILSCDIITKLDDINTNLDEFNTDLCEIEIDDDVILGVEKDCETEKNPKISTRKEENNKRILINNILNIENNSFQVTIFNNSDGTTENVCLPFHLNSIQEETDIIIILYLKYY